MLEALSMWVNLLTPGVVVVFFIRLEHRLTRLETIIDRVNRCELCPQKSDGH